MAAAVAAQLVKFSAGLLMYRWKAGALEVLLVHPGGPLWEHRELGSWTMPKGERDGLETALQTAIREFHEETGLFPCEPYLSLGEQLQESGKLMSAFAFAGDCDESEIKSNTCLIEYPPGSGHTLEIPEIDRGQWFTMADARPLIRPRQVPFLDSLQGNLHSD